MTEVTLNFTYEGSTIMIQCKRNEYMRDIFKRYLIKINKDINDVFFMCNGSKINKELKLEEINNQDNEIKILVNDLNCENIENKKILKQPIVCPECGDICLIDFKDYKIILNNCINNHNNENILLYR